MIRCAWCDGIVWPWQDTVPRIFGGKIAEMHLACAADSIAIEVREIRKELAHNAEEIARTLSQKHEGLTKTKAY